MPTINALCLSEIKGVAKKPVAEVEVIADFGFKNDAHAGKWHRQVSLLGRENIDAFIKKGAPVVDGSFGENMIIEGIDLWHLPIGTQLVSGDIRLEVTQIGKKCHKGCAIRDIVGDCIMPREGIFTKVLSGGRLKVGDEIHVLPQ
ncbi:MOSC domain-containing protein [Vagococcus acidifermentans]|uniref:MOSC domain-containing protein n=1 Tax=Vagococcus acidifermentans TaxID=564710 RepID=A0A430B2P6_9ENTE|nr:MOSC domain-containing protein [Vagococcus acidifermentans]RSU14593.1 MOSC domain-containing protein [Vagococcus acidifermentans]